MSCSDQTVQDFFDVNIDSCVGFITAFHENYSAEQNIKRNKSLGLKLGYASYDITTVCSDFVAQYQKEQSARISVFAGKGHDNHPKCRFQDSELTGYLVTNKSEGDLKDRLLRLAVFFEQTRIFIKPEGLLDTLWISSDPHGPVFSQIERSVSQPSLIVDAKGIDITFNRICDTTPAPQGFMGRFCVHRRARSHWSELE